MLNVITKTDHNDNPYTYVKCENCTVAELIAWLQTLPQDNIIGKEYRNNYAMEISQDTYMDRPDVWIIGEY